MEKDYFKDRTVAATMFNAITIGDMVYVCEKHMQSTAKELSDLTRGMVIRKLTGYDHPRGIKVVIIRDEPDAEGNDEAIGRVVYIERNGNIVYGNGAI